jgi:hypothetical protein
MAGNTDASLMQGMRSVPGSHNSKEGALALLDMTEQAARQNLKFVQDNQYKLGQPGFDWIAAKQKFFDQNPLVNPITHNALRLDLANKNTAASETKTIGNKTYYKIGGQWHEGM